MCPVLLRRSRLAQNLVLGFHGVDGNAICRLALGAVSAILGTVSVSNVVQNVNVNAVSMKMATHLLADFEHCLGGKRRIGEQPEGIGLVDKGTGISSRARLQTGRDVGKQYGRTFGRSTHPIEKKAVRHAATTFIVVQMQSTHTTQARFPHRDRWTYLNFCGIAPLYGPARLAAARFDEAHSLNGAMVFAGYPDVLPRLHSAAAALLHTTAENISYVKNTAEGLGLIALGYPFEPGDEVLSYVHEYPSNHYPWILQSRHRGVVFKAVPDNAGTLRSDAPTGSRPTGFTLEDLDALVTPRTRVIALSHVQFTSGFAADVRAMGRYCAERGIDLVVDAAQSLGALPLYPEEYGIQAIASSGWKWLMGPIGTGLLYTSPEFRSKIAITMTGADLMQQGQDYLNHSWEPFHDGRKFEYSTASLSAAVALECCLSELVPADGVEAITAHLHHLQDVFLEELGPRADSALRFESRSGILSLALPDADTLALRLREETILCTSRAGYLRIAPHLPNTDEDMHRAARALRKILD